MNMQIPNFEKTPSVMETTEVSKIFGEIMDFLSERKGYDVNGVVDILSDGISNIGYDPKGRFDDEVIAKILSWVESNWSIKDPEIFEGLVTIAVQVMNYRDFKQYLMDKINTEKREFALTLLKEIAEENEIEY